MAILFRTSAQQVPAPDTHGWGLQPELPPPGTPRLPQTPQDRPWEHHLLDNRTPHVPDPNAPTQPTLADAVTDLISPGSGGGIASPAVVQVAAGQSHLSTYLVLGAVIVGGVLAFRWWQQHHGRAAR